jgi:2-dehydro-3-deoxygalactonokinase
VSASATYVEWIAVDWGTSHLRAWAMAADGSTVAEAASDRGMGGLAADEFEPALLDLIEPWLGGRETEVTACGMVGSRQGWAEVPYVAVPCKPLELRPVSVRAKDSRLRVRLIPGLKQERPADVMRGEETQIAGWLASRPGFDGVLCLPGTHTKWAVISAGEVVGFRSFMTGELYAALSKHSVLRHSVGEGWNDAVFAEAVSDTLAQPGTLAARLFSIRAEGLLTGPDPAAAAARLSGLLIGAELAGARAWWLGRDVAVIGAPDLAAAYRTALELQGLAPVTADGAAMTRAGLTALHQRQPESVS